MQGLNQICSSYLIVRTTATLIDNTEDGLKTLECIRQDSLKTIEPRQLKDTCILVRHCASTPFSTLDFKSPFQVRSIPSAINIDSLGVRCKLL